MRTRVIPAQITTVEDKIVGSLNLMQIMMLMAPVFFMTLIYAIFPPSMSFVAYKLTLSVIFFVVCIALSLRIKGKIVIHWLSILARYNLRAKYYIYNKNEPYLRTLYLPTTNKAQATKKRLVKAKTKTKVRFTTYRIKNLVSLENMIGNNEVDFRYKIGKKGGLNVAFEQIKK